MTTTERESLLNRVLEVLARGGWHLAALDVKRQLRPLIEPHDDESVDLGESPATIDDTPTIKGRV